ncbi:C40 family peptidase [Halomonas huangheensis]|uniref:NlpC/P60 domain-containing protein n=1 Tax=Halomonas huangheensis TaxID=1178482 RepID=W1N4E5_9GAMM|nr:NlpC/P60 family protein [Halomonas huangheensis]ALM51868.1 hypothetical protein AR456_05915 [Halomonas huangheensis]ERL50393.1 hypothetical protein BJB45_04490 [Halomonas huangheensis]
MSVVTTYGAAAVLLLLAGALTGCASNSQKDVADNDYYSRSMPTLADRVSSAQSLAAQDSYLTNPAGAIREALMDEHDRWAGTPYRLGGTSFSGIDCSALVQNVFSEAFQVELPRTTGSQVNTGVAISRFELEPGDLVFFRPPGNRHVGIYVGDGRFLHASSSRGVMISKLNNRYWSRYYWQARRPMEPTELSLRQLAYGSSYGG